MPEQEVVIRISAKNLTAAEFKKARQEVLGLGDATEKTRGKVSGLERGFKSFGKAAPGAFRIVSRAAAATVGAIAGVTFAVIKLGERGAVVGDVKSAFDSLSIAVGETGETMLTALQKGVKGTISNFDLMKVANKALGTGLLKTSEDAQTLSEGSRLLAKRTGGDTVQAFETLVTAMASGRTAQLKQIGLFVDNKKAVEEFAKAQGKSVSELTDADRAAALQVATMAALRKELQGFPPPLSDFGELIERGKVGVKNLVDELAVMISNSPVLLAGMQSAGDAIAKAFGNDTQGLALGLVNLIERAALTAVQFGKAGITAAQFITRGFAGIKVLVLGVALAFVAVGEKILSANASILEAMASIPVLGAGYKESAIAARSLADGAGAVSSSLQESVRESAIAAAGNDALGRSLQTAKTMLDQTSIAMVNAGLSQREMNQATAEGVSHVTGMGTALGTASFQMQELTPVMVDWQGKLVETSDAARTWREIVGQSFSETKSDTDGFGTAVAGVGDLVAVKTAAMAAAFASFGLKTKAQTEATVKDFEAKFELIKKSGQFTADELAKIWAKHEEAVRKDKETTTDFQMTSNEAILSGGTQLLQTLGSKNKAAAIASAVIGTAEAVVQALRSSPPPGSWILAAINAAMGAVQIATIRSAPAFRKGTEGLDFEDFGVSSSAFLHGREAVIPQGGGHQLAQEIAGALARTRGPSRDSDALAERFDRIGAELAALPRAIQRAVRDGVLLAS